MKIMGRMFIAFLFSLLFVAATPANAADNAASHIALHMVTGPDSQAGCPAEVQAFVATANKYPRPAQWQFFIVCDEKAWTIAMKKLGQYDPRYEIYGSTYLDSGITYIRGWKMTHPDHEMGSPDRIVAHELAHIYMKSTDDEAVDALARQWVINAGANANGAEVVETAQAIASHGGKR